LLNRAPVDRRLCLHPPDRPAARPSAQRRLTWTARRSIADP